MRVVPKALFSGLFLAFLLTVPATASEIKMLTHSVAGSVHIDSSGAMRGNRHGGKRAFNLELVRELMTTIGVSGDFIEIPFKTGLQQVVNEPDFAFFNVSRTAEREHLVKWVGPLQLDVSYLYKMKENPTQVLTMEDAREVEAICVLRGGVHFRSLYKEGFHNLIENDSYVKCFQMLAAGRVNLTVSAVTSLTGKLQQAGIDPALVEQTPVMVSRVGGYIAFSRNIPDSVIQRWQDGLDALKRSGKYRELYTDYFLP